MPVSFFVNNNVLPCPKDVTSYLEVSYQCLSGKERLAHLKKKKRPISGRVVPLAILIDKRPIQEKK